MTRGMKGRHGAVGSNADVPSDAERKLMANRAQLDTIITFKGKLNELLPHIKKNQSEMLSRLNELDSLYYPAQSMIDAKNVFKINIDKIVKAYWTEINDIINKDYEMDRNKLLRDIRGAGEKFNYEVRGACEALYREAHGFNYDAGVADYFKDFFKFLANLAIRAVNIFKTTGYGLFEYSSSKSAQSAFALFIKDEFKLETSQFPVATQ